MADSEASSSTGKYRELQASDRYEPDEVIKRITKQGREKRRDSEQLEHEALIRQLIMQTRKAFENSHDETASALLLATHWKLRESPGLLPVLAPGDDRLDAKTKLEFQEHCRIRDDGDRVPNPSREFAVQAKVAEALEMLSSVTDPSRYAPVRFEPINEPGATTTVDEPTPLGRIRIKHSSTVDLEQRVVEISHQSCDHVGAIALPRQGKDSTLVSWGMNLHKEHGYKYFSIMDDGRMETPMIAIPNDEPVIQKNLERLGQDPEAMPADVYVPAMGGVPDYLPGNFELFTIGIDSLTPHLILRLAGVSKSDETVESRIKQALDETLEGSGSVSELVSRLEVYSREMEATIEWTEIEERTPGNPKTETYHATYQMDAESALETAAQRIAQLAAEGLITSPKAATNIDMHELIRENDRAAVLCCNFLDAGLTPLKYVIMDLWLRLIYQARDQNPRLPRVCLEIRELKNIAPSKMGDVRYKSDIRTLRQTIFFLTTQGGSRRILLLGSTQKWNDVYKAVRSNFANKLLLCLGDDEIDTLDKTHHFSYEQQDQLSSFSPGQGMILSNGGADWPVEFRGAPCGIGNGDRHWRDRYGVTWGARVHEDPEKNWYDRSEGRPAWWVHAVTLTTYDVDEPGDKPDIGEWHLFPDDLEDVDCEAAREHNGDPERFRTDALAAEQRAWVDAALEERRDHELPNNLMLEPSGLQNRQRSVTLDADDLASNIRDIVEEYGIPDALHGWLETQADTRENLISIVKHLDQNGPFNTVADVAEGVDVASSTLRNYWSDQTKLKPCRKKKGKQYELTPVGKKAAALDWDEIEEKLEAL